MPQRLIIAAALAACTHETPPLANVPVHTDTVDDLSLIPADASLVIHVDASTFRTTPIYTQLVAPTLAQTPELTMVQATCGFDPMASVTSLTFAAVGGKGDAGAAELVVHGVPRDRALACLPKLPPSPNLTLRQDRDTWILTSSERPMGLRFVGADALVIAIGPSASQAGTDALIAGPGLTGSTSVVDMHAKIAGANVWFVTTPPAALDLVETKGIRAAFGSVDLHDGAAIDVTLRYDTPVNAAEAARTFKAQSAEVASFTSRVAIAASGTQVRVTAFIDRDKLASFVQR